MNEWFVKARRAQSDTDDESWQRGGVSPTLNAFDNGSESRATVLVTALMGNKTHTLTGEGHDAGEDGTGRGTPVIAFSHTQGIDPQASETATPTLRREGGGHGCHE